VTRGWRLANSGLATVRAGGGMAGEEKWGADWWGSCYSAGRRWVKGIQTDAIQFKLFPTHLIYICSK
jgi:hypothetical protein